MPLVDVSLSDYLEPIELPDYHAGDNLRGQGPLFVH